MAAESSANLYVESVEITPNPATVGGIFKIAVAISMRGLVKKIDPQFSFPFSSEIAGPDLDVSDILWVPGPILPTRVVAPDMTFPLESTNGSPDINVGSIITLGAD